MTTTSAHAGADDASRVATRAPAPFLKWVGGKRQLVPRILGALSTACAATYYEPFVGGGAVFFALVERQRVWRAVLSDVNGELILTYRAVRDEVDAVIAKLRTHVNDRDHFYAVRAQEPATLSPAERAARLIFLNRTCFNGLYRVNVAGRFNVSFGRYVNPNLCDVDGLHAASRALRCADLRTCDFAETLAATTAHDVSYCDPPYVPLSATSSFTSYASGGFTPADQRRLRDAARDTKARGVRIVLSNSSAPLVRELYRADFTCVEVAATRAVNCRSDRRGAVSELLIA
ncbi:MAG: DNA adenine methylase [Polyangiales bacterium]